MYLRGRRQWQIAEQIGICQQMVCHDLKEIRKRWRESTIRDFDELRSEQLEKIDTVESEYWAGFERSQSKRHPSGNPSFLAGVERCIERRCKLLGLDAPQKIAPTTPDGTQPYRPEPMTPEEAVSTYMEAIQRATANG